MEEENKEKSYEEMRKEEDIKIARGIICALKNVFNRQKNIDDPCLKNCLFVDKLSMTLDIAMGVLKTTTEDMPEDLKLEIESLSEVVNSELNGLMEWCRAPTYSPDHPFGNKIVSSFSENVKLNDQIS